MAEKKLKFRRHASGTLTYTKYVFKMIKIDKFLASETKMSKGKNLNIFLLIPGKMAWSKKLEEELSSDQVTLS